MARDPIPLPPGAGVIPTEVNQDVPPMLGAPAVQSEVEEVSEPVNVLDEIGRDELGHYIVEKFKNDRRDRDDFGWADKRDYDTKAYRGLLVMQKPWKGAADYNVPLTRTLLDTAKSNVLGSIFADPEKTVDVEGIGIEDIRKAPFLASLLNWQVNTEIKAREAIDSVVFRAFHDGTGVCKVIQSAEKGAVEWIHVLAENIYLPLTARGFQVGQTDHVFELIALDDNDYEERLLMRDPETGGPLYDGVEDIPKGFKIYSSTASDQLITTRDKASGTGLYDKMRRDFRYIMECYLTYFYRPKGSNGGEPKKKVELVCAVAPGSGKVLRLKENKGKTWQNKKTGETITIVKRPYAWVKPYPLDDRAYGESLPERIKQTQLELNHAHNQNINAADIAIRPPTFYRQGADFDAEAHTLAPGAFFPVPEPKDVYVVRVDVNPIFERQEDRYWDLAERDTGLTELFQGRSPDTRQTATLTVRRENKTEIRFKDVYDKFETFWNDLISLTYYYDSIYMPKSKKIKIIGVGDYKTIEELFPEGIEGEYNFGFSSAPLIEVERKRQDKVALYSALIVDPRVQQDVSSWWRVSKMYAEAMGERNFEVLVTKPKEVNILAPEEAIQRIMSGQQVIPDPLINAEEYLLRIQLFMMTDTFQSSDDKTKSDMTSLLQTCATIKQAQMRARLDAQIIQAEQQAMAIARNVSPPVVPASANGAKK